MPLIDCFGCVMQIRKSSGEQDNLPQYKKRTVVPETVVHVKVWLGEGGEKGLRTGDHFFPALILPPSTQELDILLAQLASTVNVDIMPGPNDPTNQIVPQQVGVLSLLSWLRRLAAAAAF